MRPTCRPCSKACARRGWRRSEHVALGPKPVRFEMSASRRLATFNRPRRTSPIRSVLRSLCRLALVCGIMIPHRCLSYADNIPGRFRDGQRLEVARQRRHNGGCDVGHRQLPTIVDAGEARFRAIGEGVKQIAQLAAEQAFAELFTSTERLAESAPSHGGGGWSVEHGAVNKWPTQNISHSSSKASLSGMLGGPEKPDIRPDLTGASSRRSPPDQPRGRTESSEGS
jgi:hypothetical protein